MTFYDVNNHRQQVEILRRFSSDILTDKEFKQYEPYEFTEEFEDTLMKLFFSHFGITFISLFLGCPEPVIIEKILSMKLYDRYDELSHQLRTECTTCNKYPYAPYNQHDLNVESLRRATSTFPCSQFEWTEDKRYMVFFLFKMGEDITDIALLLGCPELVVMQKFIDEGLYCSWDTPWFAYSTQECRDNFLNSCCNNKII